jgi:hypothetical protein
LALRAISLAPSAGAGSVAITSPRATFAPTRDNITTKEVKRKNFLHIIVLLQKKFKIIVNLCLGYTPKHSMFTINKHRKSKIANRKLFISAQDKFYDLPMICQHLLPSKAQNELLNE